MSGGFDKCPSGNIRKSPTTGKGMKCCEFYWQYGAIIWSKAPCCVHYYVGYILPEDVPPGGPGIGFPATGTVMCDNGAIIVNPGFQTFGQPEDVSQSSPSTDNWLEVFEDSDRVILIKVIRRTFTDASERANVDQAEFQEQFNVGLVNTNKNIWFTASVCDLMNMSALSNFLNFLSVTP